MNKYIKPSIELIYISDDIVTTSPTVPDLDEDIGDNELPKQEW